jgi:hypothetical protein
VSVINGFARGWEKEQRAGSKEQRGDGRRCQSSEVSRGSGRKSREQSAKRRRAVVSDTKGFARGWEKEQRAVSREEADGGVRHQRLRAGLGERAESRKQRGDGRRCQTPKASRRAGRKSKEQEAERRRAAVSVIRGFAREWEKEQGAVSKEEMGGGISHQRLRAGGGRKSKEQGTKRRRAMVSDIKGFARGRRKSKEQGTKTGEG